MKKAIAHFFLIIVIVFCFDAFTPAKAQIPTEIPTEQEIKQLLCHKWTYAKMSMGGLELPLPLKLTGILITFNLDGTLVKTVDEEDYPGKWAFEYKKLLLKTDDKKDGLERNKIIGITDSEMKFRNTDDGVSTIFTLKRVE